MSSLSYKQSPRNPALENDDEYFKYEPSSVPLITHNGIIETRKTADLKLIRNQSMNFGVEFQYLPLEADIKFKELSKNDHFNESQEIKEKIQSKRNHDVNYKKPRREDDARSFCSQRSSMTLKNRATSSLKSIGSHESLNSKRSIENCNIESFLTSNAKEIFQNSAVPMHSSNQQFSSFISQIRNPMNGLDEDDQLIYRRR